MRLEFLVNADRIMRKLPSLLVDGSTTKKRSGIVVCVIVIVLSVSRKRILKDVTS